jgi:hypothetical protein
MLEQDFKYFSDFCFTHPVPLRSSSYAGQASLIMPIYSFKIPYLAVPGLVL